MKKQNTSHLAIAVGGTLVSGLASTTIQANTFSELDANPFALTELSTGYMQTAKSDSEAKSKMKNGACGDGKCGSSMMKGSEEKTAEGNCAGNKPMPKMKKNIEGKCGEGKCGDSMKK